MKTLNCICLTLTIIGAIVWGIIGLFSYNIVDGIWFRHSILEDHIYTGGSCRIVHHIFLLVSRQRSVIILINIQKMPTDILSAGIF